MPSAQSDIPERILRDALVQRIAWQLCWSKASTFDEGIFEPC